MSRSFLSRLTPSRAVLTAGVAVAAAVTATLSLAGPAGAATTRTFAVSPTGTGIACTATAPCDLPTALAAAVAGDTVQLAGGSYGDLTVKGGKGAVGNPITVVPAPGATPSFHRLLDNVPNVAWSGITVTNVLYLYPSAHGSSLTNVLLDGAGLMERASDVTVASSEFRNGSTIDGIQISDKANNVLIRNNWIHDYNQSSPGGYHADCIQMFDASNVTIRGNRLANCYNSAITFSAGAGIGLSNVLIESNFAQGCVVRSTICDGPTDVDLRYTKTTNITVRNNTFVDGDTFLGSPNMVFDRNIVSYLDSCNASMTNSVVAWWNTKGCGTPTAIGKNGTRQGTVHFVAELTGNLHLVDPTEATVQVSGTASPAATDIDGDTIPANLAGADAPASAQPAGAGAGSSSSSAGSSTGSSTSSAGSPQATSGTRAWASTTTSAAPTTPSTAAASSTSVPATSVLSTSVPATSVSSSAVSTTTPARDTTAPVVTITAPVSGSTATGSITAIATATDDVAVSSVRFLVGGTVVGNAVAAGGNTWKLTVNTAGLPKGSYRVVATASDAAGNVGTSAPVTVTVK
jgi:hypothetical protein